MDFIEKTIQACLRSLPLFGRMLFGSEAMNASIFHPIRLVLYAVLSAADLGLTYALIQRGDGDVYESNPIAEAWLSSYGWTGLALYKLVIVLIVASVAAFVSLSRPRTGLPFPRRKW